MVESNACMKSRLSKVYRNVTLRDGIKSGEFTDRGSVSKMDDCVKQCCGDENCNLAFVIKETCFTVKCKGYDTCSLKPAVSRYYNPKIAFVNWSPPKDNLVVGKSARVRKLSEFVVFYCDFNCLLRDSESVSRQVDIPFSKQVTSQFS